MSKKNADVGKHRPERVAKDKATQKEVAEWLKRLDDPAKSPNQPRATGPTLE